MTGQSSATPFMKVTDCNQSSDRLGKKSVTFDVMETLERHGDSIDKLTSLISKMNVKIDKDTPYKPRFTKTDLEATVGIDNKIFSPATDPLSGIEIGIEKIIIITTDIIDPTIEIGLGTITGMVTEDIPIGLMKDAITTDKTIEGETTIGRTVETDKIIEIMTLDRDIEIRGKEGIDPESIVMTETEVEIEVETDIGNLQNRSRTLSNDRGGSRSRSSSRITTNRDRLRCYRCGECDHFAQEFPNTPTYDEMGHSDSEPALLQMLAQEDIPLNFDGGVEYLNLEKARMVPPHFCQVKARQVEKWITSKIGKACA